MVLWLIISLVLFVVIPLMHVLAGSKGKKLQWQLEMFNTAPVRVNASREVCSDYIRNIDRMMSYEQKVVKSTVVRLKDDGKGLEYSLTGWVMGIPWGMTFDLDFRGCGGFYSKALYGPINFLLPHGSPSGGFYLKDVPDSDAIMTDVYHYERYRLWTFTPFAFLLAPIYSVYLKRTMEVEMEVIKVEMEAIQRGEKPARVIAKYGLSIFLAETLGILREPFSHYSKSDAIA